MEFHEAANIFPLLEGSAFDEFADDIEARGLQDDIELFEGKVLDGRNRLRACEAKGVEPRFKDVTPDDPLAYVRSKNLHRRQLDAGQLAMVAARTMEYQRIEAKKRMKEGGKKGGQKSKGGGRGSKGGGKADNQNKDKGKVSRSYPCSEIQARDEAGATVGVSGASVQRAYRVLQKGSPELQAAVDARALSVSNAETLTYLSNAEQREAVEAKQNKDTETTKRLTAKAKKAKPPGKTAKAVTKKAMPGRIAAVVKELESLIRLIKKSTKGFPEQRKRAAVNLKLARKYTNEAAPFLT